MTPDQLKVGNKWGMARAHHCAGGDLNPSLLGDATWVHGRWRTRLFSSSGRSHTLATVADRVPDEHLGQPLEVGGDGARVGRGPPGPSPGGSRPRQLSSYFSPAPTDSNARSKADSSSF